MGSSAKNARIIECAAFEVGTLLTDGQYPKPLSFRRKDLPKAGLANVTATYMNMLGFSAPDFYEPSLIEAE